MQRIQSRHFVSSRYAEVYAVTIGDADTGRVFGGGRLQRSGRGADGAYLAGNVLAHEVYALLCRVCRCGNTAPCRPRDAPFAFGGRGSLPALCAPTPSLGCSERPCPRHDPLYGLRPSRGTILCGSALWCAAEAAIPPSRALSRSGAPASCKGVLFIAGEGGARHGRCLLPLGARAVFGRGRRALCPHPGQLFHRYCGGGPKKTPPALCARTFPCGGRGGSSAAPLKISHAYPQKLYKNRRTCPTFLELS